MAQSTTADAAQLGDAGLDRVSEWQDDYKAANKKTTFREDWQALLGAVNPRLAPYGHAAAIIWPLSVLVLGVGLITAFSSGINWHTLPMKSAALALTIAFASLYWPHRIVRYFNLDGQYPRPFRTMTVKERRLRLLYKVWIGLLVVAWLLIAFVFATAPVTPDAPAEGRGTTVLVMLVFLAALGFLPWLIHLKNKTEAAKEAKRLKAAESAPKTISEAEARLYSEAVEGDIYPWLVRFVRFRYRVYGLFVPEEEPSKRYLVRAWGKGNGHRRSIGPFARAYDWVMEWVLLGIGWLIFRSLGWAVMKGWNKIKSSVKRHVWHWITSHL